MTYNVAVIGATGKVGREIVRTLSDRKFPINKIYAVASSRSINEKVNFGNEKVGVVDLASFDFSDVSIALFSAGSEVSAKYAPIAAKHAVVIDNTSYFRTDPAIPLIVAEVNLHEIKSYKNTNIISNPNCAVMQLLVALKPLHDAAGIKRIVITTLQSVSGAGEKGMDELYVQTRESYRREMAPHKVFPREIAFNMLPHIGDFDKEGNTGEEIKVMNETRRILSADIAVSATCIRVPVFLGHSESVNVEFINPMSTKQAIKILAKAPGVVLRHDDVYPDCYATPLECSRDDNVYVSRVRDDIYVPNCLNLWIVSDNLRKGASLNAVQIAEELVKNYI